MDGVLKISGILGTKVRKVEPLQHKNLNKVTADCFYKDIGFAVVLAQCFGLFPVQGVLAGSVQQLKFRWITWRMLHGCCILVCSLMLFGFTVADVAYSGFSFQRSAGIVFYGSGFLTMLLFLCLAKAWPGVARAWHRTDIALAHYGNPHHLRRRLKALTAVLMSLALLEHLLANMMNFRKSIYCSEGGMDWLRVYCFGAYHQVFRVVEYNHFAGILVFVTNFVETFSWNYMDLFIMLTCLALTERFKQVNAKLLSLQGKVLTEGEWRRIREDYNHLCHLAKTLDKALCRIVLLSCANNLYFICLQLFNSLRPMKDWGILYFYVSFGYLITRTSAVLFFGANVNDQSKIPKQVLYSVPSESYCTEVYRFLNQVIWDEVALTGLNFFSITRGLILTVAGTIATYEVVMLQLNSGENATQSPSNVTEKYCSY